MFDDQFDIVFLQLLLKFFQLWHQLLSQLLILLQQIWHRMQFFVLYLQRLLLHLVQPGLLLKYLLELMHQQEIFAVSFQQGSVVRPCFQQALSEWYADNE
jgi:hypothetical protein